MSFRNILDDFYLKLDIPTNFPEGVEVLNPYQNHTTQRIVNQFFDKFYRDDLRRILLIGINPGRFGGGVTGIGFTDPIHLESVCGIVNPFEKRHELSSVFMYQMIDHLGGPEKFFQNFLFSSVYPLGFVKEGKNLNYYDIPELKEQIESFMVDSLRQQIDLGGSDEIAFSIGMGENIKYLRNLNNKYSLFKSLLALPHPRWIMQYRRKRIDEFLEIYKNDLEKCIS